MPSISRASLENDIDTWRGNKAFKSLAYFGPSNDASPIWFLSQKKKYNHFLYIDASPRDDAKASERRAFWHFFEVFMAKMGIRVDRIQRRPFEKRVVFFLTVIGHPPQALPEDVRDTSAPKCLVLEYFTRPFQVFSTRAGLQSQSLLLSKLAKVVGLENAGSSLPKVSIRRLMPKLKEVFNSDGIDPDYYSSGMQPHKYTNVGATTPSSRFLRSLITPNHSSMSKVRDRRPLYTGHTPVSYRTWRLPYEVFGQRYLLYDV
jgi:hypothetical protein